MCAFRGALYYLLRNICNYVDSAQRVTPRPPETMLSHAAPLPVARNVPRRGGWLAHFKVVVQHCFWGGRGGFVQSIEMQNMGSHHVKGIATIEFAWRTD